jgi:acetoin utilization deacetylase AcuC-like enzyme
MVAVFYRDELSPPGEMHALSTSPTKPRRFMSMLESTPLFERLEIRDDFDPIAREDLLLAHEEDYVDAYLAGRRPLCESSELAWSVDQRDAVLFANGCLLAAIRQAVEHPEVPTLAPVSGFHHARPQAGSGFCSFSGQVIAALRLYRWRGLTGAWFDLDGHFGNSIEDSRAFAPELERAIPRIYHINPAGAHATYLSHLKRGVERVRNGLLAHDIDYVGFAHGADSHEWDQLGMQCTTDEWIEAARMVYTMLAEVQYTRPVPVTMVHFGGYRSDHPESVLGLHAIDLAQCFEHLERDPVPFEADIRPPA